MKLLSKWPLTHHLNSQRSLSPPFLLHPRPPSTFTCPCECSVYCNCIQHLALQTVEKPAHVLPPTLVILINRLFVQAYQAPYPLSLCGCLWTLCSLYWNRTSLLSCEGGFEPIARDASLNRKPGCCVAQNQLLWLKVYPFKMCELFICLLFAAF